MKTLRVYEVCASGFCCGANWIVAAIKPSQALQLAKSYPENFLKFKEGEFSKPNVLKNLHYTGEPKVITEWNWTE